MLSSQLALWARVRLLPITRPMRLACSGSVQLPVDAPSGSALHNVAIAMLPAFAAAWTLFPAALADLVPGIVMIGKRRTSGKSKRHPKPANHGARPCNHVGRKQRAAAAGNLKYQPKK